MNLKLLARAGICNVSGKGMKEAWSSLAGHACVIAGHHAAEGPACCVLLLSAALAMLQSELELLFPAQQGSNIANV